MVARIERSVEMPVASTALSGGPSGTQPLPGRADRGGVLGADLEDALLDGVDLDPLPGRQQPAADEVGAPHGAPDHHDAAGVEDAAHDAARADQRLGAGR